MKMIDEITGETNETTTLSIDEQEIEIQRPDYETDSDYNQAIAEAKAKLGFRGKFHE